MIGTRSLAVVALIIAVAITASLIATRGQGRREIEVESAGAFRLATEEEMADLEPVWRRRSQAAKKEPSRG